MLCMLSCLAFVCLITDCVLALSHCIRKPSSLFIGWAFTRGSEKELETGCLCGWGCDSEPDLVSDMWVGGGIWSWTPKQGHCQPGCSDSLQQKVAWALQREQRCLRPRSPATGPIPKLSSSTIPSFMRSLPLLSGSKRQLHPPKLAGWSPAMAWCCGSSRLW